MLLLKLKFSVFYSSKYCSKNPYRLSSTLSLLYTAQLQLRKYGSKASDFGSPSRTTKCLIQKVLHKAGQIEVADQQAAAANLGMDSFYSSHKFCYVFIWDAIKKLPSVKSDIATGDYDSEQNNEPQSVLEVDGDGKFFTVTQIEMYKWRSSAFQSMSLYDYSCCVRLNHGADNKEKSKKSKGHAGRKKLKRYPFHGEGCPIPETMSQTLSTNPSIPIMAGPPPPPDPGEMPNENADKTEIDL